MSQPISNEDIFTLLQNISTQNSNIVQQNKDIKKDIENMNTKITEICIELEKTKIQNNELIEQNKILKTRVYSLEKKTKKYNIVIYGLKGNENEILKDLLIFFNDTLKITCCEKDIRDAYRIGKPNKENIRPLVVELLTYNLKSQILLNAKQGLKDSGIYIALDYTQEDYKKRKFLHVQLKLAREKGYRATIKNDILTVNGENYKYEELINGNTEDILIYTKSNTGSKSAPATPTLTTIPNEQTPITPTKIADNLIENQDNRKRKDREETPGKVTGTIPKLNTALRSSSRNRKNQNPNK